MTAIALLRDLRRRGVTVAVDGDELAISAPKGAVSPELRAQLAQHKPELIRLLTGASDRRERIPLLPRDADGRGEFVASFAQQRLWVLHQLLPDNPFCNLPIAARLSGHLDAGALQRSLEALVARHETLRTHFRGQGDAAVQVVGPPAPVTLAMADLRELSGSEREPAARRLVEADARRPFDLASGPLLRAQLLRLADADWVLQLTLHHIIADGWSMPVLFRDLGVLYEAACSGKIAGLPELPVQYADFAVWQRQWLTGEVLSGQLEYWRGRLDGMPELDLPTDRARPGVPTYAGERESLSLSPRLTAGLRVLGRREGATLYMVLLAAFNVLLRRYTRQDDLVVGSPIANRTHAELEELIGFFVNSLVMRTDASGNPTFVELLGRVKRVALEAYAHQDLPFERLVEELNPQRDLSRNPLFQVMFAVQNTPGRSSPLGAAAPVAGAFPITTGMTRFDLEVQIWEAPEQLAVDFCYSTELFDAASMRRMLGLYARALETIVAEPGCCIDDIDLVDDAERRRLVAGLNATAAPYPRASGIALQFELQARRAPLAIAVAYGQSALRYADLDLRANQLAQRLRRMGVRRNVPVGVLLPRAPEMVIAWLGVLKAGGAYVPLDPEYPSQRLAFMLADTAAPALVTQESLLGRLDRYAGEVLCLDRDREQLAREPGQAPGDSGTGNDLAYIIYTSGSTGEPKGVAVPQRAVLRLVCNTDYLQIEAGDCVVQASSASFDAATFEVWGALLNGARVEGASRETVLSPNGFGRFLHERGATVLFLTTALFNQMMREAPGSFSGLRALLFGGEAVEPKRVRDLMAGNGPRRLLHVYGPTECTTFASWHEVREVGEHARTVPIGLPIRNTTLHVLDERMRPVPAGLPGELYCGGDGVALGYFGREALTRERFVADPFGGAGDRLYRTGDLVRRLDDGTIEFLGRVDAQVKLRGFRIEPGEIEAALRAVPGVTEALVLCREDQPGDRRLVAYVTTGSPSPSVPAVRASLREKLPDYMVPSAFVVLDQLPLTPNGKVNRRTLPAPEGERHLEHEYVPPRGVLATAIAAVWSELLGVVRVGAHDNFFDLGGNSLLLVRAHERLQKALDRSLRVVELFQYPTVDALARHLGGEAGAASAALATARERIARRRGTMVGPGAIAVIGMAGRFPGAASVDAFWQNLCAGVESIRFFTPDELRAAGVSEAELGDRNYVPARGFFEGAECFDATFFGYTPREAELIDPQQRAFLECAAVALDDAGCDPGRHAGLIGVYAGSSRNSYLLHLAGLAALGDQQAAGSSPTTSDHDFLPTRVSYKLNLRGPSVNVQSACSTSLVAVHYACRALIDHECDVALAGGVSVTVPRMRGYLYQQDGIASPDGHCRPFDADARGTVPGEGVAIVALKRLEEALRDGDQVRAVILGTAINNDGSGKVGFTAPSVEGQAEVVALAQAAAGIDADSIGFLESHGTGTALGDPIEVEALNRVFGARQGDARRCYLGALKSNVGHLDAAAGVAGLIKAVLALEHRKVPPTLHFRAANPGIDFTAGPFVINTVLQSWEAAAGAPRRAGVSSFGMGGTNAHAVLEEAPSLPAGDPARPEQLLTLSARSESALQSVAKLLADHIQSHAPPAPLADIAFTLQVGRRRFPERFAIVARDHADAVRQLRGGASRPGCAARAGERAAEIVFMFPGQGTQYPGMGRRLLAEEPVFRKNVEACCERLRPALGRDLLPLLFPADGATATAAAELSRTALTQPALFVIEYALAQLWMEWGIRPQAMIGHSIGEYVAACLSGVMALDDALAIVAERGRLMDALPRGAMLGVPLSEAALRELTGERLSIASVNGPELCVASGPEDDIERLAVRLEQQGHAGQRLRTSHAFHSGMMDPVLDAFTARLRTVSLKAPAIPYVSNVTGNWITPAEATDPAYYARHLRATVRFSAGLETLYAVAGRVLLEVGPGRALGALATRHPGRPEAMAVVSSLSPANGKDSDVQTTLGAVGRLWVSGIEPDWAAVHGRSRRRRVALPAYPLDRRPYLVSAQPARLAANTLAKRPDPSSWLYLPSWKRLGTFDTDREFPVARWLLFMDRSGVGHALAGALTRAGASVVCVHESPVFEQCGTAAFSLCANEESHYARLFEALRDQDSLPERVVHLWLVTGPEQSQNPDTARCRDAGFFSITYLARGLAAAGLTDGAALLVLTDGLHDVLGHERVCPDKALVLGPCSVIEAEYPGLRCRAIDIDCGTASPDAERLARALATDASDPTRHPVLAYRGAYRWAQSAEPLAVAEPSAAGSRLRERGTYLITGGLGGMGLAFARYLAGACRARLVLTGRTGLPRREEWKERIERAGADDAARRKIEMVQALEAAGSEVMVCAADAADRSAMADVIAGARRRFGPIHGVIHAAGIPGGGVLERQTRATVDPVFAPKVTGTRLLDELLREDKPDFLVLCSSLISFLGLAGRAEYISANAYIDAYARAESMHGRRDVVSINWDTWTESGMSVGAGRAARDGGDGMSDAEGVEVLRRVLAGRRAQVLVSVRDFRPRELEAIYSRGSAAPDGLAAAPAAAPRRRYARPPLGSRLEAPRNEAERALVEIWQDLLGIEPVGVHDNFFELGGDSVLGLQIVARARQAGLELRAKQVFEHQTVAELAAAAGSVAAPRAEPGPVSGLVPLTPIQHWFFEQALPYRNHFNQSMLLKVPGSLDPDRLARALGALADHHDALRCRYERDGSAWRQRIAPPGEVIPLQVVDLPDRKESEPAREVTAACARLATQLDLETGPVVQAGYFRLAGDREGWLALIVHHLVVDAVSWPILIEDLQAAYAHAGNGAAGAALGSKTTSLKAWSERLAAYAETTTLGGELGYWRAQLRKPIRPLPRDAADGDNTVGSIAKASGALTQDETRALSLEVHGVYDTRITDLLLAALWESLSDWSKLHVIGISIEGHGRDLPFDDVDLSRTVGWFTSVYPVYLDGPAGSRLPGELIPHIKEQLAAIPANGTGYGVLRYLCPRQEVRDELAALPAPEAVFLYLGQMHAAFGSGAQWTPASEPVGAQRDSRNARSHLFEISAAIGDGRLVTEWTYSRACHHDATVQALVDRFLQSLRALIAHCRDEASRGQAAQRFTAGHLTRRDLDAIRAQLAARGGRGQ